MTRLDTLRTRRTNHGIACVAAALFVPFFAAGSYLTFIIHPVLAIIVGLVGVACILISCYQAIEFRRHVRLIIHEESARKRFSQI